MEHHNNDGRISLSWARKQDYLETAKILVDKGANAELQVNNDKTSLS